MRPPRLAFVVPYGYPALAPSAAGLALVGGAEMQQARLARVLAGRGHEVWMVTADFGQPARTRMDGITVERAYRPFAGIPGLRFFHPRWSGIVGALERVQPDVVYQRVAGPLTGQCALWAKGRRRRFVFACAHDFDTLRPSPSLPFPRDRFLYEWGLRQADRVLAQSAGQARALAANYGITAKVVRNVIPLPAAARPAPPADRVVWLGTIKAGKRPGWLLEVARALPEVGFVLAGGPPPPPLPDSEFRALRDAARALPNVEMPGFVRPDEVPSLLARARLFLHTSPAEGFPNTLLEAWALGVPSVSIVDPDGAVSTGGAGVLAADLPGVIAAVRALWGDAARREALGAGARAWVTARHAPGAVAAAFEDAVGLPEPAAGN